jgi:hypothetical protein
MEHRWGERSAVHVPIRLISAYPQVIGIGRMTNVSLSGGFIADFDLRLFSLVQVVLESTLQLEHDGEIISGYVTRVCDQGIGVEWCEFGPPAIIELLRTLTILPLGLKGQETHTISPAPARMAR